MISQLCLQLKRHPFMSSHLSQLLKAPLFLLLSTLPMGKELVFHPMTLLLTMSTVTRPLVLDQHMGLIHLNQQVDKQRMIAPRLMAKLMTNLAWMHMVLIWLTSLQSIRHDHFFFQPHLHIRESNGWMDVPASNIVFPIKDLTGGREGRENNAPQEHLSLLLHHLLKNFSSI